MFALAFFFCYTLHIFWTGGQADEADAVRSFFSSQEILSRKEVRSAIKQKRITVNGSPAQKVDMSIDAEVDIICLDGRAIHYEPLIYLMLNKPQGVVSATEDRSHMTVLDLVPPDLFRSDLFPAGRLDKDTTGFVLLTNDGDFSHHILAPDTHIEKRYEVIVDGTLSTEEENLIRKGVTLADGYTCRPCGLMLINAGQTPSYEVILHEGKYHQIKRMFGTVGKGVLALKRTQIGGLVLDPSLPEGACRKIMHKEIDLILCNS